MSHTRTASPKKDPAEEAIAALGRLTLSDPTARDTMPTSEDAITPVVDTPIVTQATPIRPTTPKTTTVVQPPMTGSAADAVVQPQPAKNARPATSTALPADNKLAASTDAKAQGSTMSILDLLSEVIDMKVEQLCRAHSKVKNVDVGITTFSTKEEPLFVVRLIGIGSPTAQSMFSLKPVLKPVDLKTAIVSAPKI